MSDPHSFRGCTMALCHRYSRADSCPRTVHQRRPVAGGSKVMMIRGPRRHPWMILTIVVTWLALQQSISPGTILVGLVLGLLLTYLWDKLDPPRVRMRHPVIMARLWW